MASRSDPQKHEHVQRVISHNEDWTKVLVSCKTTSCFYYEVLKAPKSYRAVEFYRHVRSLEHTCCA